MNFKNSFDKLVSDANCKDVSKNQIALALKQLCDECITDLDRAVQKMNREKVDAFLFAHPLFLNAKRSDFSNDDIYAWVCESRQRALENHDFRYARKLIVSLTSFPARIHTVYNTLSTIYNQTMQPYKVILWLAKSQFPLEREELPESLLEYCELGLEIRFVDEDLRPHKKYVYAMQEYPEALIVTIDDDLLYDPYMLETLFVSYLHFPDAVSSVRAHLMLPDSNKLAPYSKWAKEFSGVIGVPSYQLFSTSGAGTLYPPGCMDSEVFNKTSIRELCLNADDLWLKVMQLKKGTPVVLAVKNEKLNIVEGSQNFALQHSNVYQDANDEQLNKVLSVYDNDKSLIKLALSEGYDASTVLSGLDLSKDNSYGLLECRDGSMQIEQKLVKAEHELKKIKKSKFYRIFKMIVYIPDLLMAKMRKFKRSGGIKAVLKKRK